MTPEEITKAETLVNGWIAEDHPVKYTLYPTQEALDRGAIGPFGERYGDTVKVYQMGADDHVVSLEICGGPHVEHTGQLAEGNKTFKITKEEASSAGIRLGFACLATPLLRTTNPTTQRVMIYRNALSILLTIIFYSRHFGTVRLLS